jgi:PelA/Pel-15E family pectate lyase
MRKNFFIAILVTVGSATSAAAQSAPPTTAAVTSTMRTATDFMFQTLANEGGFVWFYTMDLEPYGELKARESMIWVEPPSTPSVGLVLLEAHETTGDAYYLECALEVAGALAKGQHPSGGWNYFIDFDPQGLPAYYESFFSRCWGWQEYLKLRDNATFDDYSTSEPTRFFLRLYGVTKDEGHKRVLEKALDHILRAQYPDGGWPQRFPNADADGDYTSARTFNDDIAYDCVQVLLEAHERMGDERYRAAAIKGMDFYLRSQLPSPQAGWAQQYDADLKPAWGRPFEIGTLSTTQTMSNILQLIDFYGITGDKRYLAPIPAAADWLEASRIAGAEGYTHTNFYEMGSNRPVYIKQTGTDISDVKYTKTFEKAGCYPYAHEVSINVAHYRAEYARLMALSPEGAIQAYRDRQNRHALPTDIKGGHLAVAMSKTSQTPEGIGAIVTGLDERGGWRDDVTQLDPFRPFTEEPLKTRAYIVGGYIARMYRLINFLNAGTVSPTRPE